MPRRRIFSDQGSGFDVVFFDDLQIVRMNPCLFVDNFGNLCHIARKKSGRFYDDIAAVIVDDGYTLFKSLRLNERFNVGFPFDVECQTVDVDKCRFFASSRAVLLAATV